jgi:serine/threonine-protein kinase RsbW
MTPSSIESGIRSAAVTRFAASITPDSPAISDLTERVADFLSEAGVDVRAVHHVALVVEEIITNVAEHGGNPDARASVAIEVRPDRVCGEIGDTGAPFDPRTAAAPDLDASLAERKIGGLGIHLVRELTASLDYRREGQQNWTTFCILRGQ